MPSVQVVNLKRDKVGEIVLKDEVFGAEVNEPLLYDVVKAQLASRRAGTHKSKVRAEVSGSTKKIYKQKGTGQARHGSKRAPNFVGGGKAHGPVQRDYSYRPTRKMRAGALCSALSLKLKEGHLLVVDNFELSEIKTKGLVQVFEQLNIPRGALVIEERGNANLAKSARNLPKYLVLPPEGLNVYDILRFPHLVVTRGTVAAIEGRCKG